MELWKSSN